MYLVFTKIAFARNLAYRFNFLMGILSSVLHLLIQVCIWTSLYEGKTAIDNVTLTDMLTYTILNTFVSAFAWSGVIWNIGARVKSGEIVGDFIRPINMKYSLLFEQLGDSIYDVLFTALPIFIGSLFFISFRLPSNPISLIFFFVSIILGFILINSLQYALGLTSFWFKQSGAIRWFNTAFMYLFSGMSVPIWFYPDALKTIANCLPWKYIIFEPIAIYLEQVPVDKIWQSIGLQVFWIVFFELLGKYIWKKAQKYVFVQGG